MMQLKPYLSEPKSSVLENTLSDDRVPYFKRLHRATWIELSVLFCLAAPSVVVYFLNYVTSMSTQIFCGHLGNLELAASSLGNSGTQERDCVRVGNELGAGHPKSAAFAVVIVTLSSLIIALIFAVLVLVLHHDMSYAFTSGSTVADAVSGLYPYLVVSVLLSGVQPVLSGVAVGCGWQAFVAYINVGSYHFIGIPLGCILGFKFEFGARGIWSGMIGGSLMQTVILVYVISRTDWVKEVRSCIN